MRFPNYVGLNLPDELAASLARAVEAGYSSKSQYARIAIADRLERDGFLARREQKEVTV